MQRAYGYVYDPLSRLLQGDFVARAGGAANTSGAWTGELDHYRLSFASYDDNGNLLSLRRRGLLANATRTAPKRFGPVDQLAYAYLGNRLQAVDDQVTGNQLPRPAGYEGAPASLAGDFQEGGTRLSTEYLYDANGNTTQDRNKGISGIAYNHLNLPRRIHFGTGADSLVFRYTAAGQKVAKLVYQTGKPMQRTDYLGPYQYEQDSLRFFPHAEGRVLRFANPTSGAVRYEREFTFKDIWGNLRLAYRAGQRRTYQASLEQDEPTHRREAQQFDSLSVSLPVAVPTGLARTGGYAARLNAGGTAPQPLGPFTQLTVQQGDTLSVTAPGLYPQATSSNSFVFSLAGFVAALLQPAPGAPAGADGSRRNGLPLLQVGLSAAPLATLAQLPGGVPQGYLRVLVFNEDSVLVDQRTVQLSAAALGHYETLQTGRLILQQNGYVSVYVGNESAADVYFDDVTIEHRQGLQVQENHYDPWGLSLVGLDYHSPGAGPFNKYQFNGQERHTELGLNLYTYRYREYDTQIARFTRVDPLAENFPYNSDYAFAENKVGMGIELEGLELFPFSLVFEEGIILRPVIETPTALEPRFAPEPPAESTTRTPRFTPQQHADFQRGIQAEAEQLAKNGYEKNTKPFEAVDPKTGQKGTTVPDYMKPDGGTGDVKNVKYQGLDRQMRLQREVSNSNGAKPELLINKSAKISKPMQNAGFDIKLYSPIIAQPDNTRTAPAVNPSRVRPAPKPADDPCKGNPNCA